MKIIEPLVKRAKNLERIAARHHLSFYLSDKLEEKIENFIPQTYWIIPRCDEDDVREATQCEIELWRALCPKDPDNLTTIFDEIVSSLNGRNHPVTISADDFSVIRRFGAGYFSPCMDREFMVNGFIGTFQEKIPIYLSRLIPDGFFYPAHEPKLHWRPNEASNVREIQPELPPELVYQIQLDLRPFML
jgi:hypothetical protein